MKISYRYAVFVKVAMLIFLLGCAAALNTEPTTCLVSPETGYALSENNLPVPVLANKAESNHASRAHPGNANDSIGDEARESTPDRANVGNAARDQLTDDSRGGQFISGKERGDAKCRDQTTRNILQSIASNGSVSVQPVDAACPQSVALPSQSALNWISASPSNTDSTNCMEIEQTGHAYFENFWARTGIELSTDLVSARRGRLAGHVKKPSTAEKTTSFLWSSASANSLLRPKNRSPLTDRCSLNQINVAASNNSLSPDNDSVVESAGESGRPMPKGEACNTETSKVDSDAGSIPAASTYSDWNPEVACPERAPAPVASALQREARVILDLDVELDVIPYSNSLFLNPDLPLWLSPISRARHMIIP